jgi:sugar phosphate isomerase/epimerase
MEPGPALTRRNFLRLAGSAAVVLPGVLRAQPARRPSLGISLFGSRTWEDGLRDCAEIGYENLELFLGRGAATDPAVVVGDARRRLRRRLDDLRLSVSGLSVSSLTLGSDGRAHASNLEAIKIAAQMARDLYPDHPPPLQTGSSGRSADWKSDRFKLADRLAAWAETAAAGGVGLALKAHAGHAVDTVPKLLWLLQRVHNRALSVNYDYSHFEFAGVSLADSLTALRPYTTFIQVKDARMEAGQLRYLLPGEGDIDYAAYFRLLQKLSYTGPVVVEISTQVVHRSGFDFKTAARKSFAAVAAGRRATA